MVYILALTEKSELLHNVSLERLSDKDVVWYWIDFENADEEEVLLLSRHFKFHYLAVEDCLRSLERPKVDFYDNYSFFVLHALDQSSYKAEEIDVFVGGNYIVSFHKSQLQEINCARQKLIDSKNVWSEGQTYILYLIMDKIVDQYFPAVYKIEDQLDQIDIQAEDSRVHSLIDLVFSIRADLLKLRRIINSMKDLLYRVQNSEHLEGLRNNRHHFADIYDHLLKLSDMIESNREITADMRDSYMSISSRRANAIMTVLTVITTIFIPLTFIVGLYGMNFQYMPELHWKYGYFAVLVIMAAIGGFLFFWFKRKGWFNIYK